MLAAGRPADQSSMVQRLQPKWHSVLTQIEVLVVHANGKANAARVTMQSRE